MPPIVEPSFVDNVIATSAPVVIEILTKVVGALALWIGGRFAIRMITTTVRGRLARRDIDPTLVRYIDSILGVVLKVVLIVLVLGVFGVQTTTFAAMLAAGGIAIGMAWSGLLANFAAGVFLVVLRPFKVGDMISGGGVTGVVKEIALFVTTIDTADNIQTIVGNSKILSESIQNFTANPYRRVDLVAQLSDTVAVDDAIRRLRTRIATIPHVLAEPAPVIEVVDGTASGPVIAVRPFTGNATYWDVYFATARMIREEFTLAGYPAPATHQVVHARPAIAA
ncbi:MAG: mechanosensitive ion channel family protein [Deltaproteobacteria bacterium]|nr:mechanosensitive ion channel family protein [Deltaproteobacteria bacterium]MDQ3294971.1 mechanosensitive ion channel family protein [Myxococcota bacterium]